MQQEHLLRSSHANLTHKVIHEKWWSHDLTVWATKLLETNDEIGHIKQQIRLLDAALPRERSLRVYGISEKYDTTEKLPFFFKNLTKSYLNIDLSIAEIETVERVGVDPEISNKTDNTLPPRPLLVYLSNGFTARKILKSANPDEIKDAQNKNPSKLPKGVLFVPDKARGWVNVNEVAEHCTRDFTLTPGVAQTSYKTFDFVSKKLKPVGVGSWYSHDKTVVVAKQHRGVRALQQFGGQRYLKEFLKHDNMTEAMRGFYGIWERQNDAVEGANSTEKIDSEDKMEIDEMFTEYLLPFPWTGTDHVLFKNHFYYIRFNTTTIVKYDIKERRLKKSKEIPDAMERWKNGKRA